MSQEEIASFLHVLTSEDHTQHGAAWGKFLFNVEQARALGPLEKPVAVQIIEAGVKWTSADGWTTSRASQRLYQLTGVPLVTNNMTEYKHAWLYALTMVWAVDVETLLLSDRAAEAAFGLAAVLGGEVALPPQQPHSETEAFAVPEGEEEVTLS